MNYRLADIKHSVKNMSIIPFIPPIQSAIFDWVKQNTNIAIMQNRKLMEKKKKKLLFIPFHL